MHFFEAIGQDTVPREGKQHFCFGVPRSFKMGELLHYRAL